MYFRISQDLTSTAHTNTPERFRIVGEGNSSWQFTMNLISSTHLFQYRTSGIHWFPWIAMMKVFVLCMQQLSSQLIKTCIAETVEITPRFSSHWVALFCFTCTATVSLAVNLADYPLSTVVIQSLLMMSISNPSFKTLPLPVSILF